MKRKRHPTAYQEKRKEANLIQEAAAEKLGISTRNLQYIEAGLREPKISMAYRMARLYQCSIMDFIPEDAPLDDAGEQEG